jgi:hypothetical protein
MPRRKQAKRGVDAVVPPTPTPLQPCPDATATLRAQRPNANPSEPKHDPDPESGSGSGSKSESETEPHPHPELELEPQLEPQPDPETPPQSAVESAATLESTPLKHTSWNSATEPRQQHDLQRIMKGELGIATYEENDFMTKWFPNMTHPSQDTLVDNVLSKLAKAGHPNKLGISHENLSFQPHPFDSSKPLEPWPTRASEVPHHKPFVWLLDSILALAKEHRVEQAQHGNNATEGESLHRNLRFHVYGLEMEEVLDGVRPLKPDGIGTHEPIQTGTKVSWRDVEIAVEVKDLWENLISQGATYARCLFAARETRHFALLIAFNHKSCEVRFCFFQRDGLWASQLLHLRQEDGFKTFVRAVAGLLSWSTLSEAGMDTCRSDRQFFIAGRCLDITDVLCNRRSVRGRATRVYKVRTAHKPTESNVKGQTTTSDATSPPVEKPTHRYLLRSRARTQPTSARWSTPHSPDSDSSWQKAVTQPLPPLIEQMGNPNVVETSHSVDPGSSGDPAPIPPYATSVEGGIPKWYIQSRSEDWARSVLGEVPPTGIARIDDPPIDRSLDPLVETWKLDDDQILELQRREFVIVKESWLTDGHLNEGTMFKCVNNHFGVPRVLCDRIFTKVNAHQVTFWNVWKMSPTLPTPTNPEQRRLSRTIYLTEGYDICKVESPRKLVEVLLHAMLGPSCDSCSSDCCSRIFDVRRSLGLVQGRVVASGCQRFEYHENCGGRSSSCCGVCRA